jgi:hypothetical protein
VKRLTRFGAQPLASVQLGETILAAVESLLTNKLGCGVISFASLFLDSARI